MGKTLTAVFDGHVLHPEAPLDLEPNRRYLITIQTTLPVPDDGNAWDVLKALAGTLEAPSDWASEHDHYLYGTPRRRGEPSE